GIRDRTVTGVQTCALPISLRPLEAVAPLHHAPAEVERPGSRRLHVDLFPAILPHVGDVEIAGLAIERVAPGIAEADVEDLDLSEIGRASCRERVEISVVVV